jgi:hypothetical protein
MDAVRFGRALGFGARQAAKTVVTAVEAATAENPSAKRDRARAASKQVLSPQRTQVQPQILPPDQTKRSARKPQKTQSGGVGRGLRNFGEATWRPFVRLGGVLWMEVTGVFFGIFAAFAVSGVWRFHAAWRLTATNAREHQGLVGSVAMALLFGYFCVSNFVRARRRERRR